MKVMPYSFFFSVWFQTDICLTNKYLFETNIPNTTFYPSLLNNCLAPNTWYLPPCLLCTLTHKTWSIVQVRLLLVLVMPCRLNPDVHLPTCFTCHMSHIAFHMWCVTCHISLYLDFFWQSLVSQQLPLHKTIIYAKIWKDENSCKTGSR